MSTLPSSVKVNKGGHSRNISTQQATLAILRDKALRGDSKALDHFIDLAARYNVADTVRKKFDMPDAEGNDISDQIERVVLSESLIRISLAAGELTGRPKPATIELPWTRTKASADIHNRRQTRSEARASGRASPHLALGSQKRAFTFVEELASSYRLHPKVVRQGLGLAFLAPKITMAILTAETSATLRLGAIPKRLSLPWTNHQPLPSP